MRFLVAVLLTAVAWTLTTLQRRVINGEFGNGQERRDRLGSDYDAVQARVNEMLS